MLNGIDPVRSLQIRPLIFFSAGANDDHFHMSITLYIA